MGSYAYKYCMCFTRKFRSPDAQPPPDVRAAHHSACSSSSDAPHGLRRFLSQAQGESPADVERILAMLTGGGGNGIARLVTRSPAPLPPTLDDFFGFLFSPDLNPPIAHQAHQDMSDPFSHYFVFTGHNSYLTGNQLNSDSSDIPIIKALQTGVRVIELDMWPNSSKNNVDILHGGTLTAPVEMIRCLESIKEYAFCASTYPLVITLEDHLTPDLQAKVAEMLTETFGDLLFIPSSDPMKGFPSPEALMKRIIISTKPPQEYKEFLKAKNNQNASGNIANLAEEGSMRRMDSNAEESDGKDELDEQDDEDSEEDDPKFQQDTACEYRKLITIHAGKPKGHLRDALKVDPDKVRRLSLSETQLAKATSSHGADVIRFTQKNILRVYPKGTRVNSSNYDPMNAWTHGAQMVAFNMQGHDKALRLMQGFFRANGGCGYVKKPDFLLTSGPNGEVFDPKASLPVKKTLKVKVYMGDGWRMDFSKTHFDTFSPPDFYTRVGIAGVKADSVMKKTRTIEDQWVPMWDEEFTFPLTVPELALLRIEVQEYDLSEKHDFGGQTCLPVWELKQGIRAVPLHDRKGNRYKSVRLLMRFDFV
ncbi:phosphoinositide phospholipase C 2-like isoform X1 [Phragmites australis]|uniref:phosphoinositide phospholipase C 2-like isoform X1 n=1 Tax=Phragmites australis TaxID=29695 RepID=UPI002D76A7CC|nr:phosphoinositide phospholipase C 2-like isoform X1 [Phragmites australis]